MKYVLMTVALMFGLVCPVVAEEKEKDTLTAVEQAMFDHVNAERVKHGLPALELDKDVQQGTRNHAFWMARYRSMSHASGFIENIAMGQPNTRTVIRTWMNSSGHRANILRSGVTRLGVSAYEAVNGVIYWCMRVR